MAAYSRDDEPTMGFDFTNNEDRDPMSAVLHFLTEPTLLALSQM
eukprot:CAMPEP_0182834512 /NCGR_PEP_ID=MMETSP0006_2-20121128/20958_1 /TAXON_ID=97485 /ORGANISM="Prymnesium parvum, Strain Texoma1" /LENGTH=43 /DNA_ID= /DNA_START= /DNA_END= /DNA_ORIENTATION=